MSHGTRLVFLNGERQTAAHVDTVRLNMRGWTKFDDPGKVSLILCCQRIERKSYLGNNLRKL